MARATGSGRLLVAAAIAALAIAAARAPILEAPTLASLSREGECMAGGCAGYRIDVRTDGTLDFFGRRNCRVLGHVRSRVDRTVVASLQALFTDAAFFDRDSLEDPTASRAFYDSSGRVVAIGTGMSDIRRATLFYSDGVSAKSVYFGAGPLSTIARRFDEILDSRQWTGVAPPRGTPPRCRSAREFSLSRSEVEEIRLGGIGGIADLSSPGDRMEAHFKNGFLRGFRITSLESRSFLASCGFRERDIVHSIGPYSVDSPERALQAFRLAVLTTSVTVGITRDGNDSFITIVERNPPAIPPPFPVSYE